MDKEQTPYEAVIVLNDELYNAFKDFPDFDGTYPSFEYSTDGYSSVIEFLGETVWSDDESIYDENDVEINVEHIARCNAQILINKIKQIPDLVAPPILAIFN